MVAVILVAQGLVADNLESLLKAAGWAPRRLSNTSSDGDLETHLRAILTMPGERDTDSHTALIAAVDLLDADRLVEQILGRCSRVRVLLVTGDAIDRETRRALVRALRAGADDFVTASAVGNELTLR